MGHSYTNLLYHIVFSTKERQPWLDADISTRLYDYLGGAIRSEGGTSISINGCADHVHLLTTLRQDKAVSDVLRAIKANSSGWMHRTFHGLRGFAWQSGYGAFSVSQSQVDKIRQYIANQQIHHHRVSFKEEFIALLDAHGIEYDERYLWLDAPSPASRVRVSVRVEPTGSPTHPWLRAVTHFVGLHLSAPVLKLEES